MFAGSWDSLEFYGEPGSLRERQGTKKLLKKDPYNFILLFSVVLFVCFDLKVASFNYYRETSYPKVKDETCNL